MICAEAIRITRTVWSTRIDVTTRRAGCLEFEPAQGDGPSTIDLMQQGDGAIFVAEPITANSRAISPDRTATLTVASGLLLVLGLFGRAATEATASPFFLGQPALREATE